MKIYTRKGDAGMTSLLGGVKLPKSHIRIESYGNVDELNAYIGLVSDQPVNQGRKAILKEIQDRLFTIGATLATAPGKDQVKKPDLLESDITLLENHIDQMEENLPALKAFVLPGGDSGVSFAHVARCVCRRAERSVINLDQHEPVEPLVIKYLNRLSDYLFVLSRKMTDELGAEEIYWQPRMK